MKISRMCLHLYLHFLMIKYVCVNEATTEVQSIKLIFFFFLMDFFIFYIYFNALIFYNMC